MSAISWSDFEKVEIRCGTVIDVKDFPKAKKPSYQIWIDFGAELGNKLQTSSANVLSLVFMMKTIM
jgi:tRNA-binding protein